MIAIDTNVLVYAEGIGDGERISIARETLDAIPNKEIVISLQALAELTHVLARKSPWTMPDILGRLDRWKSLAVLAPTMESTLAIAASAAADHGRQIFDAIILAAAAESGCFLLVSEDLQDGFVWRGVTVANPFAPTLHPLLADALRR